MSATGPLERCACDLCGRDDAAVLVVKNGFNVVRCRQCQLVYVNPRPVPQDLAGLYVTPTYVEHQSSRARDASARRDAEARADLVARHHATGALLDVGCSTGWFLQVAVERGWRATGLDVSPAAVGQCRARGLDARLGTLTQNDLPAGAFDVITLFDSIEHMPSPTAALRAVRRLLAPGGVAVITTPNVEGMFPRLTYLLLGRTFGAWDHPGPPGHVYQFGRRTLREALRRTSFETVYESTEALNLAFSVGELEDAVMDVLAGRARRAPSTGPSSPARSDAVADEASPAVRAGRPGSPLKRAVRRLVRSGAWLLAGAVSWPAPLVGAGDSLIVVARAA